MITELYAAWTTAVVDWSETNPALAMFVVFALAFAESIVLLAAFVPSTVIFAGIGAIYATAGDTLLLLWLAGALGAICGDACSFSMGRILKDDLHDYWPFRDYPGMLVYSRNICQEWGWFALIASKFSFGLRPFIPLSAGMFGMSPRVFVLASSAAGVLWAGVTLGAGFVVARAFTIFL